MAKLISKIAIKLWAMTLIAVLMCVNLLTFGFDGALVAIVVGAIAGLAGYEIKGGIGNKILDKALARLDEIIPFLLPRIPEPYRSEITELLEKLKSEG